MSPERFSIAGISFAVVVDDERIAAELRRAWNAFRSESAPRFTLFAHSDRDRAPDAARLLPEIRPRGRALSLTGADYEATFDGEQAEVHGPAERYPIEATIRLILAALLEKQDALLVHGVGMGHEGAGALFTGESGAGKSTLGGLCREGSLRVVADELVAVMLEHDHVRIEGTPWNIGAPATERLRMFGTLWWGKPARLEEVAPSQVLRVAASNVLLWDQGTPARGRALALLSEVLNRVRSVRLTFPRLPETAALLRRELERR